MGGCVCCRAALSPYKTLTTLDYSDMPNKFPKPLSRSRKGIGSQSPVFSINPPQSWVKLCWCFYPHFGRSHHLTTLINKCLRMGQALQNGFFKIIIYRKPIDDTLSSYLRFFGQWPRQGTSKQTAGRHLRRDMTIMARHEGEKITKCANCYVMFDTLQATKPCSRAELECKL